MRSDQCAGGTLARRGTYGNVPVPQDCKQFLPGDAVISLVLVQRLTVVYYDSLLSVLYLGQHSSNSDVTRVCVNDEPFSWLRVSENTGRTEGIL
jgi:predicted NAD/FAD-dependent oxidoreductase